MAGWLGDVLNTVAPGEGLRYAMAIMMVRLLPAVWAFYPCSAAVPGAYRKATRPWQLPHEGGGKVTGKDSCVVWKMIYLARRNPALRPEEFAQAWPRAFRAGAASGPPQR